ncbi:MAG: vWA domain-containing protein [Bacteroidota bacterium]
MSALNLVDLSLAASPLLLVLCLLAGFGLAMFTYRRSVPSPQGRRLGLLVGLRSTALALVLFLLFEPIWRSVTRSEEPPVLAVLVDDSQSLSEDETASTLRAALASIDKLDVPTEALRRFRFADGLRPLGPDDSLSQGGSRTDLARALSTVVDELERDHLAGVVLVSDGQTTAGRNPIYLAERYPVPIYTVVVGDTTAQRDVRLNRVITNEIAYVGVEVPVQVGVFHDGFPGERVTVTLTEGGRRVATEVLTLGDDGTESTVELLVSPSTPGLRRFTVAVTPLEGEVTTRNNTEAVTIRVLENRRRVLFVAAAPGPDVSALRRLVGSDPNIELTPRTQRASGQFYEGPVPADLSAFDLLVLAGYPGSVSDGTTTRRLAAAVADGLPVLFVLTQNTDPTLLRQAFDEALPVRPERSRTLYYEAQMALTSSGAFHPVLDATTGSERLDRLPPVLYNESRWRASPDAQTLATIQVSGAVLDDPLLVVRRRSGLRSAALLGAGTWRWSNLPEDLDDMAAFYPRLTDNLLRWLTTRADRRPVRVRPTRDLFGEGEPVTLSGQVYDEALSPISDATVDVIVTAPDGTSTPHVMRAVGTGRYALDLGPRPSGTYRFTADATQAGNGTQLGDDAGSFAVGALALEFQNPTADASLMRQLAQRSGGAVIPSEDIDSLEELLAQPGRFMPIAIESEQETPLWHVPWWLGLVVVLLAAEWVLRKRAGMV